MRKLMISAFLMLSGCNLLANVGVLEGLVSDESKRPVISARIRVYDGGKLLTPIPEAVSLQGKYRIPLPGFHGDRVTLEVEAPGFSTAKVTVVLPSGWAPVDAIVLRQQPGIELGQLQRKESPDHKVQIFEVSMSNSAASPVAINQMDLLASANAGVDCADASPGIISTITQAGSELAVRISVPAENWHEDEAIAGKFETLPCGVSRLHLSFPVIWSVPGQKTQKLRVEVPAQLVVPDGTSNRTIDLKSLQAFVLRLIDDHQHSVDSKIM